LSANRGSRGEAREPLSEWAGLELRHLAALEAVARTGSFNQAASVLGYSQSAVSGQIASLERVVGCRVVERTRGSATVTLAEAGKVLLRHSESIFTRLRAARADVRAASLGNAAPLRVGSFQSVTARILPRVLDHYRGLRPEAAVTLVEALGYRGLPRLLERGELDLAFIEPPFGSHPFLGTDLLTSEFVLAVPADWPLASAAHPLDIADVASLPLVVFRSCPVTAHILGLLRSQGQTLRLVFRSDDNVAVQGVVAAGLGVALVPRIAIYEDDPSVRVLSIRPGLPPRRIAIARHRERLYSDAAALFVASARDVCSELS